MCTAEGRKVARHWSILIERQQVTMPSTLIWECEISKHDLNLFSCLSSFIVGISFHWL